VSTIWPTKGGRDPGHAQAGGKRGRPLVCCCILSAMDAIASVLPAGPDHFDKPLGNIIVAATAVMYREQEHAMTFVSLPASS